jgi:hypothetical protein
MHPLTLGKGKKLFDQGTIPAAFTLTESIVRVCILSFNLLILYDKSIVALKNQQGETDEIFERTFVYT